MIKLAGRVAVNVLLLLSILPAIAGIAVSAHLANKFFQGKKEYHVAVGMY
jgi:hypothetical protein